MIQFGSSEKNNHRDTEEAQRTRRRKGAQILSDDADDADGYSIKKRSQM
jgi:hypothetical protein